MKTLVGMVTFGNVEFTRLAIAELRAQSRESFDLFIVIGKPNDAETRALMQEMDCRFVIHGNNRGFPASINDICDEAFVLNDYDAVIMVGNDVVIYPQAIDHLIGHARTTDYAWICGAQFDVRSLCQRYPEARPDFEGESFVFRHFDRRPWELHNAARLAELRAGADTVQDGAISDVRNLCLFKREAFERLGYADVNFWPGGYFEDNDYCRRALLTHVRACTLPRAAYFHFWSRTIHQGGGSTSSRLFERNRDHYVRKWGGEVGMEKYARPFNDAAALLGNGQNAGVFLPNDWRIASRRDEMAIIRIWREREHGI